MLSEAKHPRGPHSSIGPPGCFAAAQHDTSGDDPVNHRILTSISILSVIVLYGTAKIAACHVGEVIYIETLMNKQPGAIVVSVDNTTRRPDKLCHRTNCTQNWRVR